jgi:hypothetical protein
MAAQHETREEAAKKTLAVEFYLREPGKTPQPDRESMQADPGSLIPSIGDSVTYECDGELVTRRVVGRNHYLVGSTQVVGIVVEAMSREEQKREVYKA